MSREPKLALRLLGDVFGQTRLISRSRVLVDQALVHSFVDKRDSRVQQFAAAILIVRGECRAKTLDLRAQLAAVTSIDLVAFNILSNAFFCRFVICH